MVTYQFDEEEHAFIIKAHSNSKQTAPYRRTQDSTFKAIETKVVVEKPRRVFQSVAESSGDGLLKGTQPSAWPRDMAQIYNIKKQQTKKHTSEGSVCSNDPYFALILQCKEDETNPETSFVRRVTAAPEPTALLAFESQLSDIKKFCTDPRKFSILQVDPTFDLGPFHVTASQFENLHLVDRRSGKPPAMVGPLYVHRQKKEMTYEGFVNQLLELKPELKTIKAIGTDGVEALYNAFVKKIDNIIHLRCFLHERQNIDRHLKTIGVSEYNRNEIIADLFGRQVGSRLEEGILDSDTVEEFWLRMAEIKQIWKERMGSKGEQVHSWVIKYKADEIVNSMIRPVRIQAGLGNPPLQFTTNRVECVNHLLSDEADGQPQNLPQFTKIARTLVERQRKNVEWAIIGKGPYRLHPSLEKHRVSEETWCSMTIEKRQLHIEKVFDTDISNCELPQNSRVSTSPIPSADNPTVNTSPPATESQTVILGLTSNEFACRLERYIHKETAAGIWEKASCLLSESEKISVAPGCPKGSRMVASSSNVKRPHLVTRGKVEGEFRCDKSCPNWVVSAFVHTL